MREDTRKYRHMYGKKKGAQGFNSIISTKEDKRKKESKATTAKNILDKQ